MLLWDSKTYKSFRTLLGTSKCYRSISYYYVMKKFGVLKLGQKQTILNFRLVTTKGTLEISWVVPLILQRGDPGTWKSAFPCQNSSYNAPLRLILFLSWSNSDLVVLSASKYWAEHLVEDRPNVWLGEVVQHGSCKSRWWDIVAPLPPPADVHTIGWPPPLECWRDPWLLLTHRVQQRWHNVCDDVYMISGQKILMAILLREMLSLAGFEKESCRVISCHMGEDLRVTSGWQPTTNWGPQSGSLRGTESCQ